MDSICRLEQSWAAIDNQLLLRGLEIVWGYKHGCQDVFVKICSRDTQHNAEEWI